MWDVLVSVPEHCISFYIPHFRPVRLKMITLFIKIYVFSVIFSSETPFVSCVGQF